MRRTKLQSDSMHVKVTITLFLRDKNMHTNQVSRTAKLTSFARLFLLFLPFKAIARPDLYVYFEKKDIFHAKHSRYLAEKILLRVETELFFKNAKNYPLLASESFRIVSNDIWRPKLSQRLEKRLAINEISRWTK